MIAAIAAHRMPLSQAEPYLDHLTSCSPCYRDFLQLQAQYRQRRTRMIFAVAASVLIVVGLATWAILRQHNQQMAHAVVDLRDRSMARGTEPPPTELPIEIARHASRIDIYLPLGSSEGAYEFRFLKSGTEIVLEGGATATLQRGLTVLPLDLNPSLLGGGSYTLQIRKAGSEWNSVSLTVR